MQVTDHHNLCPIDSRAGMGIIISNSLSPACVAPCYTRTIAPRPPFSTQRGHGGPASPRRSIHFTVSQNPCSGPHSRREREAGHDRLAAQKHPRRSEDEVPLSLDRGLLLAHQHARRRHRCHHGQHQSAVAVRHRPVPPGLLRRQGRPAPASGSAPSRAPSSPTREVGEERPARVPLGAGREGGHPQGLAQRRLPRQADRREGRLAELRHLHRPRRPRLRFPLPVQRHDLVGLQPLAEPVVALRRRQEAVVLGARACA